MENFLKNEITAKKSNNITLSNSSKDQREREREMPEEPNVSLQSTIALIDTYLPPISFFSSTKFTYSLPLLICFYCLAYNDLETLGF